ncbi:MAG: glycosyltransferase [Pseudobutyrivibrio sp.]|nr:glycosyltransferase [Pseudobutyrivibrio sp.]
MKVSVITPFYEGDKYMDAYVDAMLENESALAALGHELEVVLVNDSPWKKLEAPESERSFIKVVTNEKNSGIHYSRIAGLEAASGDYVMFLDQDDLIEKDALAKEISAMDSDTDIVIANASLEQKDGSTLLWYRNDYHKSLVWDLQTYLTVGIQIISPGQCLIKRDAIPDFWRENLMEVNGADDYFLWLLMMAKGARAKYFDGALYTHKYTGANISANTKTTDDSVYNFLDLLNDCSYFKQDDIYTLHQMITYKAQFRESGLVGKITASLANLDLFVKNYKFKKKTGTGYGFNR